MNDIRHQLEQAASDDGVPLRTDVPELLERAHASRRRHRTRTAAVAALPTAAVLTVGGMVGTALLPADSGSGDPAADAPAAGTSHPTNPEPTTDPGLPPTAQNLYQVLVTADGWTFDGMDNSREWGGSQYWTSGQHQSLEVQWYPADQYDSYLQDRRRDGTTERKVELLGQSGLELSEKSSGGQDTHTYLSEEKVDRPRASLHGDAMDGLRVYTILPAVGDYFLMIDSYTTDKAAFEEVIGSLTRVDEATWEQAIDQAAVTKAEGEAFLAEAKRDVPVPDGVEVGVEDLDLPQSPYHARAVFAGPVLCGWAEQYLDGDEQALETLRGSRDWPVLRAMRPEGGYAQAVASSIEELASGTTDKGDPYTLEDFAQAVGC